MCITRVNEIRVSIILNKPLICDVASEGGITQNIKNDEQLGVYIFRNVMI